MTWILAGVYLLFLCFWAIGWFFTGVWLYRRGLKDGLALNKGAPTIEPIPSPVQIIEQRREVKATKQQEDLIATGIANLFSYQGKPQQGGEE